MTFVLYWIAQSVFYLWLFAVLYLISLPYAAMVLIWKVCTWLDKKIERLRGH